MTWVAPVAADSVGVCSVQLSSVACLSARRLRHHLLCTRHLSGGISIQLLPTTSSWSWSSTVMRYERFQRSSEPPPPVYVRGYDRSDLVVQSDAFIPHPTSSHRGLQCHSHRWKPAVDAICNVGGPPWSHCQSTNTTTSSSVVETFHDSQSHIIDWLIFNQHTWQTCRGTWKVYITYITQITQLEIHTQIQNSV